MASPGTPLPPEMRVTNYDRSSSLMIAVVVGLALATLWFALIWFTNRQDEVEATVPLELIELPGGFEDGVPDETLKVESPEDVTDDPSVEDTETEETEIQEMIETVVEFSDQASQQSQQVFKSATSNSGKTGSATGTGGRPLGSGPGESGLPREQRWFIRFADDGGIDEYAAQLDAFGIELGVLQNNQLILLSNLSRSTPTKRVLSSGKERATWMYFTWQGGNRKQADEKLLAKAGVRLTNGTIFHFYPAATEQKLAQLEYNHQQKKSDEIRRTYFIVQRQRSGGFDFAVSRQYLRR